VPRKQTLSLTLNTAQGPGCSTSANAVIVSLNNDVTAFTGWASNQLEKLLCNF